MDTKVLDSLHVMLCGELEDMAKKGSIGTHENLDILKDLLDSLKNVYKIEKYKGEMKEGMDEMGGYSQRKYYIDADYNPIGHSFNMGRYDMRDRGMGGNSYGGPMYDDMGGNSYLYYDPRYDRPMDRRGYSMTGSKQDMVTELKEMMKETSDENIRAAISEAIKKMEK